MAGKKALSVLTQFSAIDGVTSVTNNVQRQINTFSLKSARSLESVNKASRMVSSGFKSMLKFASITTVMYGLTNQIRSAVEAGAEFDAAMSKAIAKFGDIKKGSDAFKQLEQSALKAVAGTEFLAKQGAEGLEVLALAGYSAEQAYTLLPGYIDLATASGEEFHDATQIALGIMGQFNLKVSDTNQLLKNSNRVMDTLAKTATSSMTDISGLSESFSYAGSVANVVGVDIETLSTAFAKLGDANIRGTMAGTTMKNSLLRLVAPSKESARVLHMLGVKVEGNNGKMRDFFDIIGQLQKGLKGYSEVEKAAALDTIFGQRAIAGMTRLLSLNVSELKAYRDSLYNADGTMKKMASTIRENVQYSWMRLKSKISIVGVALTHALAPALKIGIQLLEDIADRIGLWVLANDGLIGQRVSETINAIATAGNILLKALPYIVLYAKAFTIVWAANKLWVIEQAISGLVYMIAGLTGAQEGLNLAMSANPMIALVTLYFALGYAIDQTAPKMRDFLDTLGEQYKGLKPFADFLKDLIDAVWAITHPIQALQDAFSELFGMLAKPPAIQPFDVFKNIAGKKAADIWAGMHDPEMRRQAVTEYKTTRKMELDYKSSMMGLFSGMSNMYRSDKGELVITMKNAGNVQSASYNGDMDVSIDMGAQPLVGGGW